MNAGSVVHRKCGTLFAKKGVRASHFSALSHIEREESQIARDGKCCCKYSLIPSPIRRSKVFETMIKWKCDHGVSNAAIQGPLLQTLVIPWSNNMFSTRLVFCKHYKLQSSGWRKI